MLESFLGILRKRRRTSDEHNNKQSDVVTKLTPQYSSNSATCEATGNTKNMLSSQLHFDTNLNSCNKDLKEVKLRDMEIDSTPVPPPQEYSDNPNTVRSEDHMNIDYSVDSTETTVDTAMDGSGTGRRSYNIHGERTTANITIGANADASSSGEATYVHVDDSEVDSLSFDLNERFVSVLDQLDTRIEKFRKDAVGLQEQRDNLLMTIDLIKSNEGYHDMTVQREEIRSYVHRLNSRLATVELNVRTVRDSAQLDALSQINAFIDAMLTMGDPALARQRCQEYLNACSSSTTESGHIPTVYEYQKSDDNEMDVGPIDKKFESVLLGCTLDDQKIIKKRLLALMDYLNKQIISN